MSKEYTLVIEKYKINGAHYLEHTTDKHCFTSTNDDEAISNAKKYWHNVEDQYVEYNTEKCLWCDDKIIASNFNKYVYPQRAKPKNRTILDTLLGQLSEIDRNKKLETEYLVSQKTRPVYCAQLKEIARMSIDTKTCMARVFDFVKYIKHRAVQYKVVINHIEHKEPFANESQRTKLENWIHKQHNALTKVTHNLSGSVKIEKVLFAINKQSAIELCQKWLPAYATYSTIQAVELPAQISRKQLKESV